MTSIDAVFDYDIQRVYTLIVRARDRGSPPRTGTTTVTVYIEDTNNKNPYFDPPTLSESVYENSPVGFILTTVTARDSDANSRLEVSFVNPIQAFNPTGNEVTNRSLFENLFSIDNVGVVRVNQPLDRDIVSFITFTLYARDTSVNPPQEGRGSLFIRILEYNDQAPFFELPFYNLSVLEERPLASFVGSILARDEDDQVESYELVSNPGELFSITLNSGVLRVNKRLDYEAQHNVTLIAEARDNGRPPLSNRTTIFINIININDNPPVFNQTSYQIDIMEHSQPTTALTGVAATDRDEGDYGVVLFTTDSPYFRVDNYTGEIFLRPGVDLDRENLTSYSFQVTAYDSPNDPGVRLFTTAPVYVVLEDKNDHCPVLNQPSYSSDIAETASLGDQVVELFATDADIGINHIVSFTIDASSASPTESLDLFSIRSFHSISTESGRIEVNRSLRGKSGIYNFTVLASDRDGNNSTGDMCQVRVPVTIRIYRAINDAPRWVLPPRSNFSIDVLESQYLGMLVYDCLAIDNNTGPSGIIDYYFNVQTLVETTPEFRINSITCVIRAQIVFDREQVNTYLLTLVARDRGTPPAASEIVLVVNVLDVNDNDPEFPMRNGETIPIDFEIDEGKIPENGIIGTVTATDRDSDHKNNKIYYKIVAGNDKGYFELDRERGELRLSSVAAAGLDREEQEVHSMDILAYNEVSDDTVIRNRRRRSTDPSIVTVNIRVKDINDSPPKFSNMDYYGCVSLDAPFGKSILTVEATDPDASGAAAMQYSIINGTGYFSVDQSLGIIRTSRLLTDINSRQPTVIVQADDDAAEGNNAATNVKIFITDSSNEVVLEVAQAPSDVRFYQDQIMQAIANSSAAISYVCISEISNHAGSGGATASSDVYLSAVGPHLGGYRIYYGDELYNILIGQLNDENTALTFRSLYIKNVETDSEKSVLMTLTEDPVLVIFIIAILLVILALLLFCLACCLIRNASKKKMKKLRAEEHTHVEVVRQEPPPEIVTSVNPVYDNKGFQHEDEYAVVSKSHHAREFVASPVVPVVITDSDERDYSPEPVIETTVQDHELEPYIETTVQDHEPEPYFEVPVPHEEPVPVIEVPVLREEPEPYIEVIVPDVEPEPIIITEPIMSEEPLQPLTPLPRNFFDPEPADEDPEPVIETEIMPGYSHEFSTSPGGEIEVEIRDSPPDSPPASYPASPPDSPPDSPAASPPASPPDSPPTPRAHSPPDSPPTPRAHSPPDSPPTSRAHSPPDSPANSAPGTPRHSPTPPHSRSHSSGRLSPPTEIEFRY